MGRTKITLTKGGKDTTKTSPSKKVQIITYIVGSIVAMVIVIAIMGVVTSIADKDYGKDTSIESVKSMLSGIGNCNKTTIKENLYPHSKSFSEDIDTIYTFAESNKNNLSINIDSAYNDFTENDWNLEDARLETKLPVSDAKNTTARIMAEKKVNGVTFSVLSVYNIGTYEINDKWYVHYLSETMSFILDSDHTVQSDTAIGSDSLGYIPIDRTWTKIIVDDTEASKFIDIERYNSGFNEITLGRLDSVDPIQSVTDYLLKQYQQNGHLYISESDSEISNINAKYIMSYNPEHESYVYTWLFKPPMSDGSVHYICLETTEPYATYSCVRSYKY